MIGHEGIGFCTQLPTVESGMFVGVEQLKCSGAIFAGGAVTVQIRNHIDGKNQPQPQPQPQPSALSLLNRGPTRITR